MCHRQPGPVELGAPERALALSSEPLALRQLRRAGDGDMPHSSALKIGDRQSTVRVVGRNCRGGSHRGSPCPVLSAELATSRIPTSCFARAAVSTRTEGARFAPPLAGSHARSGFLGAGGFPFRDPEVQRDTRSR
jgi:hypothetical protein